MDIYQSSQYPRGQAVLSAPAEIWITLLPILTRFTARTGRGIQQFGETKLQGEELQNLEIAIKERDPKSPLSQRLKETVSAAIASSDGLVFVGR